MSDKPVSRRAVLASGTSIAASFAGCISTSKTPPGASVNENSDAANGSDASGDDGPGLLKAGGSSTVFPIARKAASYWSSNPPASDEEYWGPSQYDIQTDEALADYWASLYGFDTASAGPPYNVTVGLSHSGTGLEKLMRGQTDIGNSSAPASAEFPNFSEEKISNFTDHVVGVDAQPIVVSQEIYDAGVTSITAETLKAIYKGEIKDWRAVPGYEGPSRSIQAIGRASGSGTDTAFRLNLYGNPNAPIPGVDVRKGKNQQVKTLVSNSNNAIAYMALAFVTEQTPAISLSFDGKKFVPGENLADEDYPLSRDLHMYTWEGTSEKEAAYLRMIISDFGQKTFVKPVGYAALTDERQQNQISKLPDTA